MENLKKIGILVTTAVISIGMMSSVGHAETAVNEQPGKIQIQVQVAATELEVTKEQLIKKFKELFPNQFDFLTTKDFSMSSGHQYFDDDTIRYNLSFNKVINRKSIYGSIGFVGKGLEVENFYYQPSDVTGSLFPAKTSKEKAQKLAVDFVNKTLNGQAYQLQTNSFDYYFSNKLLTEPIQYPFTFIRTKDDVQISDQRIDVTVLGNGEITSFYRSIASNNGVTFDDAKKVKDKNAILDQVKKNISATLQYQINYDYQTGGGKNVQLIYVPTTKLRGVHALTGKWQTANGFSEQLPADLKIERLATSPLPVKTGKISKDDAKKIAEKVLKIDSNKVKLIINSVDEIENQDGQPILFVHYMYEFKNGGHGASLEINQNTGEIIQYYNIKNEVLAQIGQESTNGKVITQKEALANAIKYVKESVPSYLHNYAKPLEEPQFYEEQGTYYFSFPRIVNNILVSGDQIGVGIGSDGSLQSLNVNYQTIEEWPSAEKVISKEKAKELLIDALSVKLQYEKQGNNAKEKHYNLVYVPTLTNNSLSSLDAKTGKWASLYGNNADLPVVTHPTAEAELNYLIQAKILEIADSKTFNANSSISKGEAIKIIMKSLTYIYEDYYRNEENIDQSFENINPDHPYYQVIERAVTMGVIKTDATTFDLGSKITREELATWYIRVLGLEQAAKNSNIYKIDFTDANKVKAENTGYVALASTLELFTINNKEFSPNQEVTFAELAVSTIRLAHLIAENGRNFNY